MAFPGIPEDLLAQIPPPDPLDLGELRLAVTAMADPPDGPLSRLVDYGNYLLAANQVVRLTGARDWKALLRPHLLDCVLAASFVPNDARTIVDWGSGGGMPGLVWATLFPEKRMLLIEKTGKKAEFLKEAAVRLDLSNVEVLHAQAEQQLRHEERPDLIVARAVEPLPKLLRRIRRHRVHFGSLWIMAGPSWEQAWDELEDQDRRSWVLPARHRYQLGGDLGTRELAIFKPR